MIKPNAQPTETATEPHKDTDTIEQPKETETSVVVANREPKSTPSMLYQRAESILHNNKDLFSVWLKHGDAEIKLERLTVGERIGVEKKVGFSQ